MNGTEIRFSAAEFLRVVGVNEYIKSPERFKDLLPGHEVKVEYIHKPNKEGSTIFSYYEDFCKAEHAHKTRVSRYETKYKDLELVLKPPFLKDMIKSNPS